MGDSNPVESPVRVLVIEDNPDDRELLQRQLRKSGMDQQVRFFSDGKEALDFLTGPHASTLAQSLMIACQIVRGFPRLPRSQVALGNALVRATPLLLISFTTSGRT